MIIDSHTHVWPRWPHQPAVPDPATRASSRAARLRALAEQYSITGVSHYLGPENDGWLVSPEGTAFFAEAARLGLIVALAANPARQADVRTVARAFPELPLVLHHLGLVLLWQDGVDDGLQRVLPTGDLPNLKVKVTGFFYGTDRPWEYPLPKAVEVVHRFYDAWGPERAALGLREPEFRGHLSYRQSLELVRTHCSFIPTAEMDMVLGENLDALLRVGHAR